MRWRNVGSAGALVLWALAAEAAEARPATLRDVLGAPFASGLAAAPAGGSVAWVVNEQGARNVWVADPPELKGRRLTPYAGDDGEELGDLGFTPDGRALVYARGGEAGRNGESPNPRSDPAGAKQWVWMASLAGGEPRKLGEGAEPVVSPKGGDVAFVKGGEVWSSPLDGSRAAKRLFHARGRASGLRWSPDGARLAFVSDRGDHSFIGVYDVAADSVRYLDPSVDQDLSPAWSADGRSIAHLRVPSSPQDIPFVPHRSGAPWSIRVSDVATGEGRLVWKAREGRGSVFRELAAADQLLWSADGRIVFPWEADGWTHLYSVPAAGGTATLLTPGDFEVEHVRLAAGGKEVVFSSNQDDVDRRHVWRVAASGGKPAALTGGSGLEWSPVSTSDGKVVVLRADARRPHGAALISGPGVLRDLVPELLPASFPESALVVPEAVSFSAADGIRIRGQLFLPAGLKAGERRPAVIFFHGGSRRQMLLGWHSHEYYHGTYAFNQHLASRGYVVLSVNYRSGIGYGMEFREAENYGAAGASEFADVLGAGLYLRSRPDVDAGRIGLWGGSYGGYLTALGLARASSLFAAGVDIHGVHDWNVVIRNFASSYDPRTQADRARRAYESSPMASVKDWRSPVLLIHGDDDRNVPFSESVSLAAALRAQGVAFEELIFPDEVHDFLLHAHWRTAYEAAAAFLDRHLTPPKPGAGGSAGDSSP